MGKIRYKRSEFLSFAKIGAGKGVLYLRCIYACTVRPYDILEVKNALVMCTNCVRLQSFYCHIIRSVTDM